MVLGRPAPLVKDVGNISLALVGKVDENDHPYSWSAILNGYDSEKLADCPNPIIRDYLTAQPKHDFGIPGVGITHIWCDNPEDAERVAAVSLIPQIVNRPEDVIGQVDAVLIPTDKGHEHLERARPFVEVGLPVFIDKPLTDREDHLLEFIRWQQEGKHLMSSSCMRYAREFLDIHQRKDELGDLRFLTSTTCKSWERYGIHAIEAAYLFLRPLGWVSVTNSGTQGADIVHIRHGSGVDVVVASVDDMYGAFGHLSLYGTKGTISTHFRDSFSAFKSQLAAFITFLRVGEPSYSFAETVEIMRIIIAGICSRGAGGRTIMLSDVGTSNPK
jgi:predicted dehydrogenase